jgi:hypothetical protein
MRALPEHAAQCQPQRCSHVAVLLAKHVIHGRCSSSSSRGRQYQAQGGAAGRQAGCALRLLRGAGIWAACWCAAAPSAGGKGGGAQEPHLKVLPNCSAIAMVSGATTSSAFHTTATYLLAGICRSGARTSCGVHDWICAQEQRVMGLRGCAAATTWQHAGCSSSSCKGSWTLPVH